MLKEWSLVIYGTSEQPRLAHRERARSAEMPVDMDFSEEYSGESSLTIVLVSDCSHMQWMSADCFYVNMEQSQ